MATNPPKGAGRIGAIRDRIQVFNPQNKHWVEIDTKTHLFKNQKADQDPFVSVRKYK